MNQAKRQEHVCKYCLKSMQITWTKDRNAPSIFHDREHEDKLTCAREITKQLPLLQAVIQEAQGKLRHLVSQQDEVMRMTLLRHPGLAQRAPGGMKHTASGLVVPQ